MRARPSLAAEFATMDVFLSSGQYEDPRKYESQCVQRFMESVRAGVRSQDDSSKSTRTRIISPILPVRGGKAQDNIANATMESDFVFSFAGLELDLGPAGNIDPS